MLKKTLESPLDCKEIQPVHPKGDQSWVFIGRTDVEAETPILWPPDAESLLIWKDPDAGKDWGQDEKRTTEDEIVGWHHQHSGYGFGWTPGVGDGQGGLACYGSWGRKELDMTEQLNWTENCWNIWLLLTVWETIRLFTKFYRQCIRVWYFHITNLVQFNMLSKLVIAFLPRSKVSFNFMAAVIICTYFGAQENKVSHCFHCFPIYLWWSDGIGCHDITDTTYYSLLNFILPNVDEMLSL